MHSCEPWQRSINRGPSVEHLVKPACDAPNTHTGEPGTISPPEIDVDGDSMRSPAAFAADRSESRGVSVIQMIACLARRTLHSQHTGTSLLGNVCVRAEIRMKIILLRSTSEKTDGECRELRKTVGMIRKARRAQTMHTPRWAPICQKPTDNVPLASLCHLWINVAEQLRSSFL